MKTSDKYLTANLLLMCFALSTAGTPVFVLFLSAQVVCIIQQFRHHFKEAKGVKRP